MLTSVSWRTLNFAFVCRFTFLSSERTETYSNTLKEHREEKMWRCAKRRPADKLCLAGAAGAMFRMLDCFRACLILSCYPPLISIARWFFEPYSALKQTNPFNPALPPRFICGYFGEVTDNLEWAVLDIFTRIPKTEAFKVGWRV